MTSMVSILTTELIRDALKASIATLAKYDNYSASMMSQHQPDPLYEFILKAIVEIQNIPTLFSRLEIEHLFGDDGVLNDNDVPVIVLKFPNAHINHFKNSVGKNPNELKNEIQIYVNIAAKHLEQFLSNSKKESSS